MTVQFTTGTAKARIEPTVAMSALDRHLPPVIALPGPNRRETRFNLRNVSPRRFAEIAHELYLEGALRWEEYQWVGFPSELHPDYDITIGALTGEPAQPDRPRDMLADVEDRLSFLKRHGNHDEGQLWRVERALDVLKRQGDALAA
jgi:hypothetical protein